MLKVNCFSDTEALLEWWLSHFLHWLKFFQR